MIVVPACRPPAVEFGNSVPVRSLPWPVENAPLESLSFGVGSSRRRSSFPEWPARCPPDVRAFRFSGSRVNPATIAVLGVGSGEDEQSFAEVGRSRFGRRKQVPLRIEPQRGQRPENSIESAGNKARDVLQEHECGSNLANDSRDVVEQPPLVGDTEPLPGLAVRLAREARSDEIHDATPRSAVERPNRSPDRSWSQETRFHLRDQIRGGEGFPLHVADSPSLTSGRAVESGFEPTNAGTKSQDIHAHPHGNEGRWVRWSKCSSLRAVTATESGPAVEPGPSRLGLRI